MARCPWPWHGAPGGLQTHDPTPRSGTGWGAGRLAPFELSVSLQGLRGRSAALVESSAPQLCSGASARSRSLGPGTLAFHGGWGFSCRGEPPPHRLRGWIRKLTLRATMPCPGAAYLMTNPKYLSGTFNGIWQTWTQARGGTGLAWTHRAEGLSWNATLVFLFWDDWKVPGDLRQEGKFQGKGGVPLLTLEAKCQPSVPPPHAQLSSQCALSVSKLKERHRETRRGVTCTASRSDLCPPHFPCLRCKKKASGHLRGCSKQRPPVLGLPAAWVLPREGVGDLRSGPSRPPQPTLKELRTLALGLVWPWASVCVTLGHSKTSHLLVYFKTRSSSTLAGKYTFSLNVTV